MATCKAVFDDSGGLFYIVPLSTLSYVIRPMQWKDSSKQCALQSSSQYQAVDHFSELITFADLNVNVIYLGQHNESLEPQSL